VEVRAEPVAGSVTGSGAGSRPWVASPVLPIRDRTGSRTARHHSSISSALGCARPCCHPAT